MQCMNFRLPQSGQSKREPGSMDIGSSYHWHSPCVSTPVAESAKLSETGHAPAYKTERRPPPSPHATACATSPASPGSARENRLPTLFGQKCCHLVCNGGDDRFAVGPSTFCFSCLVVVIGSVNLSYTTGSEPRIRTT